MSFRIQAKNIFLTYSNVEQQGWDAFTLEELVEFLSSKCPGYVIACKEQHEDGSPHFHALIRYPRKVDIRNSRHWDYGNVHPEVKAARNVAASINYIKKDGQFLEHGSNVAEGHKEVCQRSSYADWLDYCVAHDLSSGYATLYWNACHSGESTLEDDYVAEGTICEALNLFQYNWESGKALVLIGEAGCGKTQWAKREIPKPALFVSHLDDLKNFVTGVHKAIIFDDVNINHYPREGQIHIVDYFDDRSIHCRHRVAHIPARTFKCFTSNVEPMLLSDEAIRRRVHVVRVNNLWK